MLEFNVTTNKVGRQCRRKTERMGKQLTKGIKKKKRIDKRDK